jgi:acetyl-CoA synthetase
MPTSFPIPDDLLEEMNLRSNPERSGGYDIIIPRDTNIYAMTVGRQLQDGRGDRLAFIVEEADRQLRHWTFSDIDAAATALASTLWRSGLGKGDRVAIHTGMRPETAVAHMAVCKLGGIAVTLSQLYGPDTLAHALNHSDARAVLTTSAAWGPLRADASARFPHVEHVLVAGEVEGNEISLDAALSADPGGFVPTPTGPDDPALLMYTSGSTGLPKGILHGHRVLAAYTPSINLFYNLSMDEPDAVFWSPADWAWVGGLLDMLFPAWMAGRPVAVSEHRFEADWAMGFMARHGVTHTFLTPTALKRLATIARPREKFALKLRVVCTGGEALASETLAWAETDLGVACNEFYGLTEVNHLIGNCARLLPRRSGSMGIAYPGHDVHLVDADGLEVGPLEVGEIVTRADSPTRFLGYFKNPEKEAEIRLGPWLRTFDLARRDADGYFWYQGRSDDLIKSSGYRIGPTEIEDCLLTHPAVVEVAVVGKPDAERGAIVTAFIRLATCYEGSPELVEELRNHVKARLAQYKAPREITFVDAFATTTSGKIDRKVLRSLTVSVDGLPSK